MKFRFTLFNICLLYTSDAADERSSVDLGGRRIIKKKKTDAAADRRSITIGRHTNDTIYKRRNVHNNEEEQKPTSKATNKSTSSTKTVIT